MEVADGEAGFAARARYDPERTRAREHSLRWLLTADTAPVCSGTGRLAFARDWFAAFATAGAQLGELAWAGTLDRGLRAVLAHHVLFAWNRIGLTHDVQSILASAAATVIFGQPAQQPAAGYPQADP